MACLHGGAPIPRMPGDDSASSLDRQILDTRSSSCQRCDMACYECNGIEHFPGVLQAIGEWPYAVLEDF